jgi:hypothetical protein
LLWCFVWRLSEEETMQKGCFSTACKAWFDAVVVALKVWLVGEEVLAPATATRGCCCCCWC